MHENKIIYIYEYCILLIYYFGYTEIRNDNFAVRLFCGDETQFQGGHRYKHHTLLWGLVCGIKGRYSKGIASRGVVYT